MCIVAALILVGCQASTGRQAPTSSQFKRLLNSDGSLRSAYLIRLNYGLAAVKLRRSCIIDGYWTHTFHLALPADTDSVSPLASLAAQGTNESSRCPGPCIQLLSLFRAVTALDTSTRQSITRLTARINALIPDIDPSVGGRRRQPRGLFDFIGTASSYLFGSATEGDVEGLRAEIDRIKVLAAAAAADSVRTREGMATFARLQNKRLDSLHAVLALSLI